MNSGRLLFGLAALLALAPACTTEVGPSAQAANDPAVAFETLQVGSDFTFATSRDVTLRLRASEPGVAKYVEVSDDEGRRLFAGAVLGNQDLDFDVRQGGAPVLNVRVGRGADAVTQTVNLERGLGSASF